MAGISLETNMAMPERNRGAIPKYPWQQMKVGNSFLFPKKTKGTAAHSAAFCASKKNGKKFVTRKTDKGYRCWRTA